MSTRQINPLLRLAMRTFPKRVREHRGEEMWSALSDVSGQRGAGREAVSLVASGVRLRTADWRDHSVTASVWDALTLSAVLVLALMLRPVLYQSSLAWEAGTTSVWGRGWEEWALVTGLWGVPLVALVLRCNRVALITLVPVTIVHLLRVGDAPYGPAVGRLPLILAPLLIILLVLAAGQRPRRPGWVVPSAVLVSAVWVPMSFLNEPGGRQISAALAAVLVVSALAGIAAPRWGLAVTFVWMLFASGAVLNIPAGDEAWNPSTFGVAYYLTPFILAVPALVALLRAHRHTAGAHSVSDAA